MRAAEERWRAPEANAARARARADALEHAARDGARGRRRGSSSTRSTVWSARSSTTSRSSRCRRRRSPRRSATPCCPWSSTRGERVCAPRSNASMPTTRRALLLVTDAEPVVRVRSRRWCRPARAALLELVRTDVPGPALRCSVGCSRTPWWSTDGATALDLVLAQPESRRRHARRVDARWRRPVAGRRQRAGHRRHAGRARRSAAALATDAEVERAEAERAVEIGPGRARRGPRERAPAGRRSTSGASVLAARLARGRRPTRGTRSGGPGRRRTAPARRCSQRDDAYARARRSRIGEHCAPRSTTLHDRLRERSPASRRSRAGVGRTARRAARRARRARARRSLETPRAHVAHRDRGRGGAAAARKRDRDAAHRVRRRAARRARRAGTAGPRRHDARRSRAASSSATCG